MKDPVGTLLWIADDLDGRFAYPFTGSLRQVARQIATAEPAADGGCRGCGTELVQPETGRRREWCSERCRRRSRR